MELDVQQPLFFDLSVAPAPVIPISTAPPEQVIGLYAVPGPPGTRGQPGTNTRVTGETPDGVQDGVNPFFETANPYQEGSISVYRNGLREQPGIGYLESGANVLEFTTPPLPDDDLTVDYLIN